MSEKWASELFKCGYNCSQSVFAAHAAKFGIDTATALKLSAPLGGGVGRMREVCGAFSACAMLLGLKEATRRRLARKEAENLRAHPAARRGIQAGERLDNLPRNPETAKGRAHVADSRRPHGGILRKTPVPASGGVRRRARAGVPFAVNLHFCAAPPDFGAVIFLTNCAESCRKAIARKRFCLTRFLRVVLIFPYERSR